MYSIYKKIQSLIIRMFYIIVYTASIIIPVILAIQVIFRYFLKSPIPGVEELASASFIWLVIFGSAILFKEKKHIAVDMFVRNKSENIKKIIDIGNNVFMLLIFAVLIYSCYISIPNQMFYKTVVLKISRSTHTIALMISFIFMLMCCIENIMRGLLGGHINAK
ncbi:TRAP transporter small permease [Geosporobacter ferrireducens]|uniref:Tripartite ATP-independent periplasmic transporters DctQ component domain-containing protein n=1 Tax=Geosporobacter ferrireducens TaxID=1424294 RepID=A0A1D8GES2_9FIRM|nr:TRAP transporter small permease [Geosporobacter ferrireducens]AOT69393.1 hypothetical protein Gferi_07290 [Geosporobacter ferrireducens]MTI56504.1 TRAP transporter small permease [Geosporobacter ferrireducens]